MSDKTIVLRRIKRNEIATFGVLLVPNLEAPFLVTLELPWLDNRRQVSCIPEGTYPLTPIDSPKYGSTWLLENVPNRSEILIHVGNYPKDSRGCILAGLAAGLGNSIGQSMAGMQLLRRALKGKEGLTLRVEAPPLPYD